MWFYNDPRHIGLHVLLTDDSSVSSVIWNSWPTLGYSNLVHVYLQWPSQVNTFAQSSVHPPLSDTEYRCVWPYRALHSDCYMVFMVLLSHVSIVINKITLPVLALLVYSVYWQCTCGSSYFSNGYGRTTVAVQEVLTRRFNQAHYCV